MDIVSWKHPGLELTDFSVMFSQDLGNMYSTCIGKVDGKDVYVSLPAVFQNLNSEAWAQQILDVTRRERMDNLGEKMILLALGEAIGRQVMVNHNYLNTLNI